jgi:hypothetical protein
MPTADHPDGFRRCDYAVLNVQLRQCAGYLPYDFFAVHYRSGRPVVVVHKAGKNNRFTATSRKHNQNRTGTRPGCHNVVAYFLLVWSEV